MAKPTGAAATYFRKIAPTICKSRPAISCATAADPVGAQHAFIVSNLAADEVIVFNGNGYTQGATPTFAIDYRLSSDTNVQNNLTGAGRCLVIAVGTGRSATKLPSSGKC
jgi:hypothetical protein